MSVATTTTTDAGIECQGKCTEHRGSIKRVHVRDVRTGMDWGLYWYCDTAIDNDILNGLDVSIQLVQSVPTPENSTRAANGTKP